MPISEIREIEIPDAVKHRAGIENLDTAYNVWMMSHDEVWSHLRKLVRDNSILRAGIGKKLIAPMD